MCVLIHVVFAFVPEYLLGPRLTPVFIAVMLIVHVMLPVMHAYSFLVVRSHIRTEGLLRQAIQQLILAAFLLLNVVAPSLTLAKCTVRQTSKSVGSTAIKFYSEMHEF